tara:strand:+ start:601 stop:783 length:183 start_codon:yes stop_codon:yes gene_type:complete
MESEADLEYLSEPKHGLKLSKKKLYLYINSSRGIYAEIKLKPEQCIELARQLLNANYQLN